MYMDGGQRMSISVVGVIHQWSKEMKSRAREELHQRPAVGHKPYCDYVEAIMFAASSSSAAAAPLWLFIMSESL